MELDAEFDALLDAGDDVVSVYQWLRMGNDLLICRPDGHAY